VGRNRVELWGRIVGAPELRTTPAGTMVLRVTVECSETPGELALAVVMTGEAAASVAREIRNAGAVHVEGKLRAIRRRTRSGIVETGYEVIAQRITAGGNITTES
jgi:single-stranded DNA-binding protein